MLAFITQIRKNQCFGVVTSDAIFKFKVTGDDMTTPKRQQFNFIVVEFYMFMCISKPLLSLMVTKITFSLRSEWVILILGTKYFPILCPYSINIFLPL